MRRAALAGCAALLSAAAGCGGEPGTVSTAVETVTRTTTVTTPTPTTPPTAATADVVERVLRAVVNVKVVGFDGSGGEGSGVIIARTGVIVTNYHVIEDARSVFVSFNDGKHQRPVRGEVVGTAEERDLAIIQVPLNDLIPVTLGRSSGLRLGNDVLAIGFPLDLGGPTVTRGIVSGLDRTFRSETGPTLEGLLQTDAAINPGNSGGPLVDLSGRLVGINTAAARAGAAENVGFAIAIDEARPVIDEIRNKPPDQRAWIGVSLDTVDSSAEAVQLGLTPDVRGAIVITVIEGSPAARAGLQEGDVIISADGQPVRAASAVTGVLRKVKPGGSVVLEAIDQSGPRRVTVTAGKRPATLGG